MSKDGVQAQPDLRGRKVLVAVTGGIAAYKAVEVVRGLMKRGADVQVMMTSAATRFVQPTTFAAITGKRVGISLWNEDAYPEVDHLQMPHSAELILVAPATANIIAKMAVGIADDLVSTALVAATCPILIAPAMNTHMYANPVVENNIELLKQRGVEVIGPERGEMAAPGETPGLGRMSEPADLIEAVAGKLQSPQGSLAGLNVVITAGRTEEPIDDVRLLTNRSSGRMGVALAEAARNLGARTLLIHGAMDVQPPVGVQAIRVTTAQDMLQVVEQNIAEADAVVYAAAVSDWRPADVYAGKMKKEGKEPPTLSMVENPDIAALTAPKCKGITVGFALETSEDHVVALDKLKRKGLDAILLNTSDAIGADSSQLTWITAKGDPEQSPRAEKSTLAKWVVHRLALAL